MSEPRTANPKVPANCVLSGGTDWTKLAPGHSAHNQWGPRCATNKTRQLGPTGYELSNARAVGAGPLLSFVSVCA